MKDYYLVMIHDHDYMVMMHDHGVQTGGWCSVFPGSICLSGFATPMVNCGTARVLTGFANVRFTHTHLVNFGT